MKSISNRTFECIYDNVKRCNYLAKLGFDERIFSRVCFIFNLPTPPLNLKYRIFIFSKSICTFTKAVWERDTEIFKKVFNCRFLWKHNWRLSARHIGFRVHQLFPNISSLPSPQDDNCIINKLFIWISMGLCNPFDGSELELPHIFSACYSWSPPAL